MEPATDERAARGFWLTAAAVALAFSLQVEWLESAVDRVVLLSAVSVLFGLVAWLYSAAALVPPAPLEEDAERAPAVGAVVLAPVAVTALGLALLWLDLRSATGAWLWLLGLVGLLATVAWRERGVRRAGAPDRRALVAAALVAFALLLRLYHLEELPGEVVDDEGLIAEWGLAAWNGTPLWDGAAAEHTTLFRRGGAAEPMLGCAMHGAVMALAGETVFGLRLTAALAGALGVGLLYLLLREFLRPGAAFGGAFLLAVCHTHLYWTRSGMLQALVTLAGTGVMLFVLRGLRRPGRLPWLIAGVLLGLAQHLYEGGRFLVPILVPFFALVALVQRGFLRRHAGDVAVMAAASAAVFAPLGLWYLQEPQSFLAVSEGAFIFGQPEYLETRYPGMSAAEIVAAQLRKSLTGFAVRGDLSTFYPIWKPLFDPLARALVLAGIAGFTFTLRPPFLLVSLWLWVPILIACTVTVDPPPMSRLMLATPALFGVAAGVLDRLARLAERGFGAAGARAATAIAGCLLGAAALWNLDLFFVRFPATFPANALTVAARVAASAGTADKVYFVGGEHLRAHAPTVRFVARGVAREDLAPEAIPVQERGRRGAVFLVEADRGAELETLRQTYPNGELRQHHDRNGVLLFVSYRVAADELARLATSEEASWRQPDLRFGWAGEGSGELHEARGLAIGADGAVYVADGGNRRVDAFAADGTPRRPFGERERGEAAVGTVSAVAVERDGHLLALNRARKRLTRFTPAGELVARLGGDGLFDDPVGVAAAPDGSILVLDAGRGEILKLSDDGDVVARAGGAGGEPGRFEHAAGIAVADDGRVFVLDSGYPRVQRFSSDLEFEQQWPVAVGGSADGQMIAVHGDAVYVLDSDARRVQRFTRDGRRQWNVGGAGPPPDGLGWPVAVATDRQGRVWILDDERGSLYRYDVEER